MPEMKPKVMERLRWRAQKAVQNLRATPKSADRDASIEEYLKLIRKLASREKKATGKTPRDLSAKQIRRVKPLPRQDIAKHLTPESSGAPASAPITEKRTVQKEPVSRPEPKAQPKESSAGLRETPRGAEGKREVNVPAKGGAGRAEQEAAAPKSAPEKKPAPKESAPKPSPARGAEPKVVRPGTRTIARPGGLNIQDVDVPLKDLQGYRRRLQGKIGRFTDQIEKNKDNNRKVDQLQGELAPYEDAYKRIYNLERQHYDAGARKPDDWGTTMPKDVRFSDLIKREDIKIDQIPKTLTQTEVNAERFAREPGEKEGPKGQRFMNNQVRRLINDIYQRQQEIDKLDPRVKGNSGTIEKKEGEIDSLKSQLRYYREALQQEEPVENKHLTDEFKSLAKKLDSYLTPEQLEARKAGREIDVRNIPQRNAFLRTMRELGRERDRILQGLSDEMQYVNANPDNSISQFREMEPEERQDALQEVKQNEFMQKVASGVGDYYEVNKGPKDPASFEQLAPDAQQAWVKKYAANQARKGAPGMSGSDIYKFLFGGGQEFISKYPPELYRPMVQAARQGMRGLGQSNRRLAQMLQGTPMEQIYGQEAAPTLSQLFLGQVPEGQQPPQGPFAPPQPYEFPLQQEAALPDLRQMLENEV